MSKPKLRVKDWSDFQHYRDRRPAWIKLHKHLLDDFEFQRLPVASKALAPMLWLLASESNDGTIDYDVEKLAFRLRVNPEEIEQGVKPLIENGFFILEGDASDMLAGRYQDDSASLAQRREEKRREEKSKHAPTRAREADGESEKAEPPGDVACSPADLIGAIRGVVVELWAVPSWTPSSRPDKNSSRSSAEIAAAWVKAGITPERLRELVRPALERLRERNERAPSHLAYFANLVHEALDADKQRATAEKVYMTQDEWPLRLKAWRRNRIWPSLWGPDPSHPLCLAPKHMLTDEDRKPRAEVVPMRRATA